VTYSLFCKKFLAGISLCFFGCGQRPRQEGQAEYSIGVRATHSPALFQDPQVHTRETVTASRILQITGHRPFWWDFTPGKG